MDITRPLHSQDIHKILLWMPNWIGDVVLTLPVIQSLRRAYPVARIGTLAPRLLTPTDDSTDS